MMDRQDVIKVKIVGSGPECWNWKVTDAVSGREIPVFDLALSWAGRDGVMAATLTVPIYEFEGVLDVEIVEHVEDPPPQRLSLAAYLEERGFWIRPKRVESH